MHKTRYAIIVILCAAALLAGCNLPWMTQEDTTSAVQTAAALTVQAAVATATNTAVPFPTVPPITTQAATNTSAPVNTRPPAASATSSCDAAQFVTDVTIPDNAVIASGDMFTKTWRLKNIGTCSWTTSYAVVFMSGASMSGPAVAALPGNVNPGQTVDVSVDLTAPTADGTYKGNWELRNAAGVVFPTQFYVQIVVNSGGSSGGFAVTGVSFSTTGSCGAFHTSVAITTNGAGTVKYHKVFSDGGTDTAPGTLTYTSAGTQSFSFDNAMSAAGTSTWIDIYIDQPNHQQFGRATYTCP